MSFLAALMNAAQLGLEPNTPLGQAYLIPYKNKSVLECQFQIGYKGLIDLAYRNFLKQDIEKRNGDSMEKRKFGYARVSSTSQNLDRQIMVLKKYVAEENIVVDKKSGKDLEREGYLALKGPMGLRKGDTLYVYILRLIP